MAVVARSGLWQITCIMLAWLIGTQFSGTIYHGVWRSSFIGHVLDGVLVAYRQLDGKCGWIGASVVFWSGLCEQWQKVISLFDVVGLIWSDWLGASVGCRCGIRKGFAVWNLRSENCGKTNGGHGKAGVRRAPVGGLPSLKGTYPISRKGEPGYMTG